MPVKPSTQDTTGLNWSAGGITVGQAGVDLRVSPRNRSPEALEELVNARWLDESTFGRRHGHTGTEVFDGSSSGLTYTGSGTLSDLWVMGHGAMFLGSSQPQAQALHYQYPGRLQGVAARGDELIAWTGDRILVKPDQQNDSAWEGVSGDWIQASSFSTYPFGVPAIIPTARPYPVPTTNPPPFDSATSIDSSLGRKYIVVAYTGGARAGDDAPVMVAVLDRVDKSIIFETVFSADDATSIRCVFSNGYHVVYWIAGGVLNRAYATEFAPTTWTADDDTPAVGGGFDIAYVSETTHLVVWVDTAGTEVKGTYFQGPSNLFTPFTTAFSFDLGISPDPAPAGAIAVATALNGDIALVWEHTPVSAVVNAYARIYTASGVPLAARQLLGDITAVGVGARAFAIAPKYLPAAEDGFSEFVIYVNHSAGTDKDYVSCHRFTIAEGVQSGYDRYHCYLASRAFRTGQTVSVWLMSSYLAANTAIGGGTVPTALFMVTGEHKKQQITAFADVGLTFNLSYCQPSVWPDPVEETYGFTDRPNTRRWGTASLYRQAISGFGRFDVGMFFRDIDMLPDNFRTANYGKALYIAGAAVREWDGVCLVESGVGLAPYSAMASANSTGHLSDVETVSGSSAAAVYNYRTYLTWKNAQGEISRSPAISEAHTMAPGDDTITITTNTLPLTDKPGARFEYYRTQASLLGTTYYYVGTSTPNDHTTNAITFTDTTSDIDIAQNPADPFNPAPGQAVELYEALPRGCEVISSFNDRLFIAGGEIPAGIVDYSKLKSFNNQAAFNDLVGSVIVDPTGGQITSLSGMADAVVAFTAARILVVQGEGPDNLGNGGFLPSSQIVGHGATTHEGTILTENGMLFWGAQGPQLLTTGLQVVNVSPPVSPLAVELTPSGVVCPQGLREVRWYTRDGRALLMDYQTSPRWAIWHGLKVVGVVSRQGRLPELGMTDGFLFSESDEAYSDRGGNYSMTWRHGQLRPSELAQGDNRVRKVGLLGQYKGEHTLRCWVYYDGGLWYDQYFTWDPSVDVDLGGPWSEDTELVGSATETFSSPDGVYRFNRRLRRMPFATVSFRFSDGGPANNSLVPHELAIDMGDKPGLTDMPVRTYGGPANPDA